MASLHQQSAMGLTLSELSDVVPLPRGCPTTPSTFSAFAIFGRAMMVGGLSSPGDAEETMEKDEEVEDLVRVLCRSSNGSGGRRGDRCSGCDDDEGPGVGCISIWALSAFPLPVDGSPPALSLSFVRRTMAARSGDEDVALFLRMLLFLSPCFASSNDSGWVDGP